MTIGEYLKNPYGKGSAFSSSSKQKEDLDQQFIELSEKIASKIYRYRDFVIYHVVIPSTKKDSVNYDVVIEVETKNLHEGAANLENLAFKVFSNCPSFIFTYAHVFRGYGMLCEWLLPKYNKEVRTKPPVQRNQYGIVGLERSIYLALKHLHTSKQFNCGIYQTTGKKISGRTEIINSVRSQEQIMDKVREKIPIDKDNQTVKNVNSEFANKSHDNRTSKEKKTRTTMFTKSAKTVSEIKVSKKTKTAKYTKKI